MLQIHRFAEKTLGRKMTSNQSHHKFSKKFETFFIRPEKAYALPAGKFEKITPFSAGNFQITGLFRLAILKWHVMLCQDNLKLS